MMGTQIRKTARREDRRAVSIGGISVLMVFVMLCLTTFGLLTLATARAEMRLTEKNAQSVTAYYASSSRMQEILAQIDGIVKGGGQSREAMLDEIAHIEGVQVSRDGDGAVVEAGVTDSGPIGMAMRLTIDDNNQITVAAYHMQSNVKFNYQDQIQEIWPGN